MCCVSERCDEEVHGCKSASGKPSGIQRERQSEQVKSGEAGRILLEGKRGERELCFCNIEPSKNYLLCSKLKDTLGHTHTIWFFK